MNFIIVAMCFWRLAGGALGKDVKRFGPGDGFMCHCKNPNEQCDKISGNCTSGCANAWFGPGCQYRDLAQMKDKIVSQTLGQNGNEAIKAVDGDKDTCSRTRPQPNPQWEIKLSQNETITEMYIETKTHPLRHFRHIRVFVEYNPRNNPVLSELCFSDDNGPPQNESFKIKCVVPMTGNQVRIEIGQQDQQGEQIRLVLCDIRINGGRNLAFGQPTYQNSTLHNSDRYSSSKAVDGDVGTCSWTKYSGDQVWRLNLGHAALLQRIKLTQKSGYEKAYKTSLLNDDSTIVHTWEYQKSDTQHTLSEEATTIIVQPKIPKQIILCEVELFGDCTENYCGFDCKTKCNCNDMSIWNRMSAVCSSYHRKDDDNTCEDDTYGPDCQKCVNCLNNERCDKDTGICHTGCLTGFSGELCTECAVGKYGQNCQYTCTGHCKYGNNYCNHVTGKCQYGCMHGWQGERCDSACLYPKYGQGCTKTCSSHCKDNKCNHVDGNCERGCKTGWQGDMCRYPCKDGTYGDQCLGICSKQCKKYSCNKVTGHCIGGCKDGWQGDMCKEGCLAGTYGAGCQQQCSDNCKLGQTRCDHISGECEDGCVDGWQDRLCRRKCSSGMYGDQCKSHCSVNCKQRKCNHIDGKCELGCKDGWFGDRCESECEAGKWGPGCGHTCGNCSDGTCHPKDGTCSGGCGIGFKYTPMCDEECDDDFYGFNCSETCGNCNNGSVCDKITGVCSDGCSAGYIGDLCIQVLAKQVSTGPSVPVGIGAGVFLIVGIALIALFVHIGRKKKRSIANSEDAATENKAGPSRVNAISRLAKDEPNVEVPSSKSSVRVSELLQYVKQSLSSKDKLISEFQTFPHGLQYTTKQALLPDNVGKNRYKEIYPYEHSRVILSTLRGIPNSDYINASYIQGHARENAYIAAQGPIDTSLEDFWRMIWEKDVRTVAMLTNLIEETKVKCVQYWGDPSSEMTYGDLIVYNESEHIFAEFTIRRFKVFPKNDRGLERNVTHFHFTAWPDKGVPRSTSSLVQFLQVVRQMDSCKSHTWLVHCSAGVGRTGAFIAMDILYDEGEDLGTVNIQRCVQTLREQRVNMVQTKEQYKFLHGLVLELLVLPSKQIHVDDFGVFYASLQSVDSLTGKTGLLLEYEGLQDETSLMNLLYESCKLQSSTNGEDRFAAAKLDVNKTKNRYQNVLAANEFRPFLATNVPGCTNYINAVYIQSYSNRRGFILTQTPMKETAVDCCRLVIEEGVKVIVTFDYKVKDKEDVGEYLPENGSIQLGPFRCTKIAEADENTYLVRTHRIVCNSEETTVYQLIFKNWPTKLIVPPSPSTVLNFLQVVEFTNRRETGNAILVQCLNGAERSGLFAVLMNIVEHIRYDNRVSIPRLVRSARIRREQIIPYFEQYKFCYDSVLNYVENNSTYANM